MAEAASPQPDARDIALDLLDARAPGATVCPSEVARALARACTTPWRELMPTVHDAVDALVREQRVRLSWKGKPLTTRAGPYRIARR